MNGPLNDSWESQWVTTVFSLLAHRDRRIALRFLADRRDEWVEVRDLVREIGLARTPGEATDLSKIELELHHVHIPKLADCGLIDYDEDAKVVIYRGDPLVESCLRIDESASSNSSNDR